jgi:hypothetical protein
MRRDIVMKAVDACPYRPFANRAIGSRLAFRLADGRSKFLQYSHLNETELNPDVGIILEFVGHRVTLTGRNLDQLHAELESEAVGEITEQHVPDFALPADACFIRQIMWEKI